MMLEAVAVQMNGRGLSLGLSNVCRDGSVDFGDTIKRFAPQALAGDFDKPRSTRFSHEAPVALKDKW